MSVIVALLLGCTAPVKDTGAPLVEDPREDDTVETPIPGGDASDWWFGREVVREVSVTLDEADLVALVQDPHSYVEAEVSVEGHALGTVGVHLKGSSTFEPVSGKPSLKIKFSYLDPDLEVHGEERIELRNFHSDASRAAQYSSERWLRGIGVPAGRSGYAHLTLNGEDYGLYGVEEAYDERFLERWFPEEDGNLWSHPTGAHCDIDTVDCLERNETGSVDDNSDIVALNTAANLPDDEALPALLELFDADRLYEYLAAERLLGHWDSYSGNINNYYLYYHPATGKWQLLLYSLDSAWARVWGGEYGEDRVFWGCGDLRPDPDDAYNRSRLSSLCMADEACADAVAARTAELATALESSDVVGDTSELLDWVDPMVLADPKRNMSDDVHAEAVACFREWLPQRPYGIRQWVARRDLGVDLRLAAAVYAAGAPITVTFGRLQGDSDDTLVLVSAETGDVVDWVYTDGTQVGAARHIFDGTVTFAAGLPPGAYEAQARFEDRPRVQATVAFAVR